MKYLSILLIFLSACTSSSPELFKYSDRVTLKTPGHCTGYVSEVFSKNGENNYQLSEITCQGKDQMFPQPVKESDLVLVPRKVTSKQWAEIRSVGPKYPVGTKIKDKFSNCIGLTSYPYLNDDGEWNYPLAKVICPKEEIYSFSTMIKEIDLSKLLVKK